MDNKKPFIWLASYPKSGNTYMRVLLSNYFFADNGPVSINQIGFHDILNLREGFEDYLGVQLDEVDSSLISALRSAYCRWLTSIHVAPTISKVHNLYAISPTRGAAFAKDVSKAAIYFVRNPLDVVPSYAFHMGCSIDQAIEVMNCHQSGLSNRFDCHQLTQFMGSWSDHVLSWMDQDDMPICLIRYEDLVADPLDCLQRVLMLSHGEFDEAKSRRAVENSQLDRLQAQEKSETFREKSPNAESFFGRRLGKEHALDTSQVELIVKAHGDVMKRLDYSIPK